MERADGAVVIPNAFEVWVVSDIHGQLGALEAGLEGAGLVDSDGTWARPETALAVLGDSIDVGPDSLGTLLRLDRLRSSAAARGGLVTLLQGNHEDAAVRALDGRGGAALWMDIGGDATVASCGGDPADPDAVASVARRAPQLRSLLGTLAPWARWRDACLVHAGLVPGADLAEFSVAHGRLWRHGDFLWGPAFPGAVEWHHYRAAGLGRVVVGHKPVERPTLEQGGRALMVDTGAGNVGDPGALTFVRLPATGLVSAAEVRIDIEERT
jgi:serine/threonine protein phosphatase 1